MNVQKKMSMQKNAQELKVYLFTIQKGQLHVNVTEDFKAVMAYNDDDALEMIRKDYPAGLAIQAHERARIEVKKIVDAVEIKPELSLAPPVKETTTKDFVYGLLLVADKFVKNKRDQASLKRIVSKIKI